MNTSWFKRMLKSKSRPAARRRPARARLALEALESRDLMSVSAGIVNGQLQVSAGPNENIVVDHSGGQTIISGLTFQDSQITNDILVKMSAQDRIFILATVPSIVVDGQGQAGLTVFAGGNGHLDGVRGALSIINDQGLTSLTLDDSADTTTRTLTFGLVNASQGQIFGVGLPSVFYGNFPGTVTFNGGPGDGINGNDYTVQDTVSEATMILNTGTGKRDTFVKVQGTTGALTVNGQGSSLFFSVGLSAGVGGLDSVGSIHGTTTFTSTGGPIDLAVLDKFGPATSNVTMGVNGQNLGFISGLAQAPIFYAANDVESVAVFGPQTGSTYTITDTAPNNTFPVALDTGIVGTFVGAAGGNNTYNVQKTTGKLTIDGGEDNGTNTFNIGSTANTLGTIQGEVDANGGGGFGVDTVNINDQGTTTKQTYTLSVNKQLNTSELLASDAPKGIFFNGIRNANLNAGSGDNTINVQQLLNTVLLNVSTGGGNNTLNLANTGFSLDTIQGGLSFHGAGGSNTLNVDDQAATVAETYTILSNSVQRLGRTGGPLFINFDASVKNLTVNGTTTGFTNGLFTVVDTPKNAVTTLNTGADDSTVNVEGTTGPLVISATGGAQFVNIGLNNSVAALNNSVASINGAVTLSNSIGETGLAVLDAKGPAGRNVTMGVDAQGFGFISGLAPAPIKYAQNDVRGVTIDGPQGGATFTITDTAKSNKVSSGTLILAGLNGGNVFNVQKTTGSLEIEGETGKNTTTIGSTANTLDTIQGKVTVLGALGGDTLNINDQGSTTPHTYFQGVNFQGTAFLIRSGAAEIDFTHIASLHVNKGPVLGSAPAAKNLKLTQPAPGSRYVTLRGQLTDADPAAPLTLTVDWGDGSHPQTIKPGQAPFSLKHHYARKGTYTVRAVWTDLQTGQSNSQDLTVKVA
jgi:hypothetical protein